MRYPNLKYENNLWKEGFKFIAGLDEVGKGSWAGPIVAGAVILNPKVKISGLKDSKLLLPQMREKLFLKITHQSLAWASGIVSEKIIDEIGIVRANLLAMEKALEKLTLKPDYLLIDYFKLKVGLPSLSIIDGDYKITSVAAASIVAKVVRDHILNFRHQDFPKYGFNKHKGYGTEAHFKMIKKFGPCQFHRFSFGPIKFLTKRGKWKYNKL